MSIALSEIQSFNLIKERLGSKEDLQKLELKIGETKVDIIKWVFAMFFALAILIIGLYLKK